MVWPLVMCILCLEYKKNKQKMLKEFESLDDTIKYIDEHNIQFGNLILYAGKLWQSLVLYAWICLNIFTKLWLMFLLLELCINYIIQIIKYVLVQDSRQQINLHAIGFPLWLCWSMKWKFVSFGSSWRKGMLSNALARAAIRRLSMPGAPFGCAGLNVKFRGIPVTK